MTRRLRIHSTKPLRPGRGTLGDCTDPDLIEFLSKGEDEALEELVRRFGSRLTAFLDRIVRDDSWVDDLVQEVFVRVYVNVGRYDPRWTVTAWLFSIARNLAVDFLRREGRRRRNLPTVARDDIEASTSSAVEHREFHDQLDVAIRELPEAYGSVFLLRDREGLSYEEIGSTLGISVKTVSSRLHRARTQLKNRLAGYLQC